MTDPMPAETKENKRQQSIDNAEMETGKGKEVGDSCKGIVCTEITREKGFVAKYHSTGNGIVGKDAGNALTKMENPETGTLIITEASQVYCFWPPMTVVYKGAETMTLESKFTECPDATTYMKLAVTMVNGVSQQRGLNSHRLAGINNKQIHPYDLTMNNGLRGDNSLILYLRLR